MRISNAFPSKYLMASDLPDGRDVRVVIDDVRMELMEQQNEEKPVCYFQGKDRGLVLNVTNANTISAVLGDDTEVWIGHTVMLFATTTSFAGRTVPCIRVRVPRPTTQPVPVALAPQETPIADHSDAAAGDDEVPF